MKSINNLSASIRQLLLNSSKTDNRPFNELLQYYAMERFLYRLSKSNHSNHYILKGGLLFRAWRSPKFRSTMDIDMLAQTNNEETNIVNQIQEIISLDVNSDGIVFDPDSIKTEKITENADYEGIRIRFYGLLGIARISMQIDIGFGDIIYPKPEKINLPTILDSPSPKLLCYSKESSIAEKFEAMVKLGFLNSRMKDFYDIWLLSKQFGFEQAILAEAIRLTFKQRKTILPSNIDAFSEAFIDSKQNQWEAFCRRFTGNHIPKSFRDIVLDIKSFLVPTVFSISQETSTITSWSPTGPWL